MLQRLAPVCDMTTRNVRTFRVVEDRIEPVGT
jgi:hypothetical protein